MTVDTILTGKVVSPHGVYDRTSIAVKDGKIVSIGDKSTMPPAEEEVDYGDLLILPGAVDTHTHSLGTAEEGHWNSTSAAAAGGVTTINDHPLDLGGAPSSSDDIYTKAEKTAKEAIVDFSLLAAGLPEKMDNIIEVADKGVTGYKMLMHTTSGAHAYGMRAVDDGELYAMFERIAKVNQVGMVHAENEWVINYLVDKYTKEGKTYLAAHHETRPEFTEVVSVHTAIEFARALDMRLHIVHVSVPRSFDLIMQARAEGVKVTGETCPHYLISNEDHWKKVGSHFKINPPLRSEDSRQGLWKKIREGKIHMVSSDHAPHPGVEAPNVFDNPSGSPGIETMVPLVFHEGVHKGNIDLPTFAKLMSYNPAKLMGLYPQKGSIEVGCDADFAIIDDKKEWNIEAKNLRAQSGWSMFEGMNITGKVLATFVRGTKVYQEGEVIGEKGYGKWVKKTRNYDL
ncbi:dihydroorotase [Evansella cellulosilytica]|uniref:Amidohydrolase n=1 Tax=Evansella cellulosilytica (strain ATCC 21833 / DSM 2522 / FERM P-1141 / JCM 9156 / N-4) TaxID=649639 RepID=E6TTV1_EVAC2|nr:amidohydrolase family protein [Evansella cellulosilytica]ADU31982.1 amidohydrolase [Evansella cellulosilytica DSM 2522]